MENSNSVNGMDRSLSASTPESTVTPETVAAPTGLAVPPFCPADFQKTAKPTFVSDKRDLLFSLLFLLLGYLLVHYFFCFTFSFAPALCLYTVFYAAVVLAYLYLRGKRPTRESWLWLGVMLCLGGPSSLFSNFYDGGLLNYGWQFLLLILVAAYWTLCAAGALYEGGKTSSWVALDVANALFFVPFGNFFSQPRVLFSGMRSTGTGRHVLYAAFGVLLALPLLSFVLPSLFAADSRFSDWFSGLFSNFYLSDFMFELLPSLLVSLFLFGLCYGGLYRRHTEVIKREDIRALGAKAHLVPELAVMTALGVVSAVYLLFILFQGSYLFSAFVGHLPADFTFAEYARDGFFELCRVSACNVAFLLGANLLSRTPRVESKALRVMNIVVSALTLLLIATAVSKMGLYIAAYGLTPLRVLSSVFLLWLAIVFILVIVWQARPLAPVRFAVLAGAVLVALLCALPVLPGIEAYNQAHFGEATYAEFISHSFPG